MTDQETGFDEELDARGLNCPLPILQTKRALNRLQPGQTLWVLATDPHAEIDFLAFTEKTAHSMVRHWQEDDVFHFLLRRGE
ncbi:sulfurtransferase TusA family protein [Methylonatrum kenyense]|nr:sulfurtransferase TusA family protein [Methylonatrum kenyense]MCK8516658.1 sulfurtransferase TusA family protein [Methylonatrum kenyense]